METVKIEHQYKGVRIVERTGSLVRKNKRFQIVDHGGYHYRFAESMEHAQGKIESVLKWGW